MMGGKIFKVESDQVKKQYHNKDHGKQLKVVMAEEFFSKYKINKIQLIQAICQITNQELEVQNAASV